MDDIAGPGIHDAPDYLVNHVSHSHLASSRWAMPWKGKGARFPRRNYRLATRPLLPYY